MVFITKKASKEKDFPIFQALNRRLRKGEVGIEVEVEGRRLPEQHLIPAPWVPHADGSLRGESCEYVFEAPQPFDKVDGAVDRLFKTFKDADTKLSNSNRTSVHVHLNVGPFHLNRLTALMGLWFIMEDVLTNWCGEHRVGNLFCLRAKDAPAVITQLRTFIATNMQAPIRDGNHYAALNGHAIHKFGSLEFRPLRGVSDPDTLKTWVRILRRLYDASGNYTDPRLLCETFSHEGGLAFFRNILGEEAETVTNEIKWDEGQLINSLYEGVRFAQDLCYARDWDTFKPVDVTPDPFQRKAEMPRAIRTEAEQLAQIINAHAAPRFVRGRPAPLPGGRANLGHFDHFDIPMPDWGNPPARMEDEI